MQNLTNDADMSELEREFEFQMEREAEEEFENFEEGTEEEFELELPDEPEEESTNDYADRFFELSQREFESESEADESVYEILDDIEKEYFFGSLKKLAKKVAKNKLFKNALGVAKNLALRSPMGQAIKGATQLARGNLRGMLATLAKSGLSTALKMHPAGAAVLPALQALGFKETEVPEENRDAWTNYVEVAREANESLAKSLTDQIDNPVVASQLATNAFQNAIKKVSGKNFTKVKGKKIIYANRGDTIVIKVR